MILDATVLIAVDRDEPGAKDLIEAARMEGEPLRTTAPAVAQVWRDGSRQARLSRFLPTLDVRPFTAEHISLVGTLLRHSGASDAVDAHLVAPKLARNHRRSRSLATGCRHQGTRRAPGGI